MDNSIVSLTGGLGVEALLARCGFCLAAAEGSQVIPCLPFTTKRDIQEREN